MINGFYVNKQKAADFLDVYVELIENDPFFRIEFMKDKERQTGNISFFENGPDAIKKINTIFKTIGSKDETKLEQVI